MWVPPDPLQRLSLSALLHLSRTTAPPAFAAFAAAQAAHRYARLARLLAPASPLAASLAAACDECRASAPPADLAATAAALSSAGLGLVLVPERGGAPLVPTLSTLAFTHVLLGAAAAERVDSPIVSAIDLRSLASGAAGDVRALAVERFGASPPIVVSASGGGGAGGDDLDALTCVPAFLRFALVELLKNAVQSHITRYTPLGVDDAPPIRLSLIHSAHACEVRVGDEGGGTPPTPVPPSDHAIAGFAFGTGAAVRRSDGDGEDSGYGYSRNFGAGPFRGAGVGLPRAAIYAALHGGTLSLHGHTDGAHGILSRLVIPRDSRVLIDPHPALFA